MSDDAKAIAADALYMLAGHVDGIHPLTDDEQRAMAGLLIGHLGYDPKEADDEMVLENCGMSCETAVELFATAWQRQGGDDLNLHPAVKAVLGAEYQ